MERPVSSDRVVLAGFAGLLILMGALALDSARQIREVSVASAGLRKESRKRDALLDQLRTDTYRSATLARDYMLERDEVRAASQRDELLGLRSRVQDALNQYAAQGPAQEQPAVQTLRQHAAAYWGWLAPALNWKGTDRREEGENLLRTVVLPRRDELVQFVKQLSDLDERTVNLGEEKIQLVQARFQRRVSLISILGLVVGGVLAIVVVRKVRHLSEESATRFDEVMQAREDMKRLSDRLLAVQEEERRNLSRELHDDLGQTMSAMIIEVGKAESTPPGSAGYRETLAAVRRLAEENVAKVRNMALLLRPAMLDELGLVPALRWQAKEVSRRTGLRVKVIADEISEDLPESARTSIYRIVQEGLNNCVRHAKAKEARVVLQRDADGLLVSVQDDGVGFDPDHNKGLGLLGMAERVGSLGGRLQIKSQPGEGSILSTYFPLPSGQCKPEEETVT
jgi:signal transduction histidine kinase